MSKFPLHRLVRAGNVVAVRAWLDARPDGGASAINTGDSQDLTPLMCAAQSPSAGVELLRLLVERGASLEAGYKGNGDDGRALTLALAAGDGDPAKVSFILDGGAHLAHCGESGYSVLIKALHGRDVLGDPRLLDLLRLLVARGAPLDRVSDYGESALRMLSHIGRFDAVALLLDAGADEGQLAWTPLIRAVALGSLDQVAALIDQGAPLEARDWWERTAWLVAILAGDIAKAQLLRERGAEVDARGRCGGTPLQYAVEGRQPGMLRWLLETGQDLEQADEFQHTALYEAVQEDAVECAGILVRAGADPGRCWAGQSGLRDAQSAAMARLLLDAGDDPADLSEQARREFLGLPREPDVELLECSRVEFLRGRTPRPGNANPQRMSEPFWQAMIRAGVSSYAAGAYFDSPGAFDRGPVWCARRHGQTLSFLPDGRIVQIGGEHEDSYDPDFCIYNDVFMHHPDGTIDILGYPPEVFPPTDFHSATVLDGYIYLIGCLGYHGARGGEQTPLYRFDPRDGRIERLAASGKSPGWICRHRAEPVSPKEIRVRGGERLHLVGNTEHWSGNTRAFILDTATLHWRAEGAGA